MTIRSQLTKRITTTEQKNVIAYSLLKGKDNLGSKGQLGGEKVKNDKTNLKDGLSYNEMEMLDTNKDGVLSKEEFLEGTKKDKKAQEKWDNYFKEWKSYNIDIGNGKKIKGEEVKSNTFDNKTSAYLTYDKKNQKDILLNTEGKGGEVIQTNRGDNPPFVTYKKDGKFKTIYAVENNSTEKIDGKINTFSQGGTGDCWLLAGLYSLSNTKKGAKIIKDAIKKNDDGSVTVTFKGVNKSYTISKKQLKKANNPERGTSYSKGDNDVLAIELAVKKLQKDMKKGDTENLPKYVKASLEDGLDGGFSESLYYYFTGKTCTTVSNHDYDFVFNEINGLYEESADTLDKSKVIETLNKVGNNTVISFSLSRGSHSAKQTNGSNYRITLVGSHALGIKNVDKENQTVTFINSNITSGKEYTMTFEEFAKLGIDRLSYIKL